MRAHSRRLLQQRLVAAGVIAGVCALALPERSAPGNLSFPLRQERVVDLRTGQFYQGGTRVRSPLLGISFVVPDDWRVRLPAGSRVVPMDSTRQPGLGVILLLEPTTREELASRMNEPQAFEESYVLEPVEPAQWSANTLTASYLHGDKVGEAVALVGPANQAIVCLMTGLVADSGGYEALLDAFAQSVRFASGETASLLKAWYGRLSGKVLSAKADSPRGLVQEWHLCTDGNFLYEAHDSDPPPSEHGGTGFHESGTWRIQVTQSEVTLIVTRRHGFPRAHSLRHDRDTTYLDEVPFADSPSNRCF